MLGRILNNTVKQISRSGWVGWASVGVMTLAFLVGGIIVIAGYLSNQYIKYVETKPSMYVFFDQKVPEDRILALQQAFSSVPGIQKIEYTSWQQAVIDFRNYSARTQAEITPAIKDNSLPASLDVRLFTLEDTDQVIEQIQADVNKLNVEFGGTELDKVVWVARDQEKVEDLRQVFSTMRIIGIGIFGLLIVVILLFTLITVEFRTYNRSEEIGVMQLVGGSLTFIRMPYILEGAFYGIAGVIVSNVVLVVSYLAIFVWQSDSEFTKYILRLLAKLEIPAIELQLILAVAAAEFAVGALIGGIISMIAIRRYVR